MKTRLKILGFAVAALIVVALGFYFIEVYAPSPAYPTLSAAIQEDSIPIGSMTRKFLGICTSRHLAAFSAGHCASWRADEC